MYKVLAISHVVHNVYAAYDANRTVCIHSAYVCVYISSNPNCFYG